MRLEDKVKNVIELKYDNVKNFSERIGLPYTTTRSILQRGIINSNVENVIKIADGLGMKAEDLMKLDDVDSISNIYSKLSHDRQHKVYNYAQAQLEEQKTSTVNENVIQLADYRNEIDLQAKVSAGTGILDLDPEHVETISYTGKLPMYYDMAFQVSGNSMEPTFSDGDIIFVEKMSEVINGALMVVQIDDEGCIRKNNI